MTDTISGPARIALLHAASREVQHIFDLPEGRSYEAPELMVAITDFPADLMVGDIYPEEDEL